MFIPSLQTKLWEGWGYIGIVLAVCPYYSQGQLLLCMKGDNPSPKNMSEDNSREIIIFCETRLSFVIWLTVLVTSVFSFRILDFWVVLHPHLVGYLLFRNSYLGCFRIDQTWLHCIWKCLLFFLPSKAFHNQFALVWLLLSLNHNNRCQDKHA